MNKNMNKNISKTIDKRKIKRLLLFYIPVSFITLIIIIIYADYLSSESNKPVLRKDLGKICLDCHTKLREELAEGIAHKPLQAGDCISCHTPHASKNEDLLIKTGYKLCIICHEPLKVGMRDKVKHEPMEFGECESCHKSHVSQYNNLLIAKERELCFLCHENSTFTKTHIHDPVSKARCKTCHKSHSSNLRSLLKSPAPGICLNCHRQIFGHTGIDIKKVDCIQCHNPHSSERKNLLYSIYHEPYKDNKCEECHQKIFGIIIKAEGNARLCYKCHQDSKERYEEMSKTHIVEGARECTFCHNPHGSEREDLVRGKDGSLCMSCHNEIKVRLKTEKNILRHPEVIARKCSTCHDSHASNNDKFLKENMNNICLSCHKRQKVFCHPLGEKAYDPRTNKPIGCLTCHNPMGAIYPQFMRLEGEEILCKQCHNY